MKQDVSSGAGFSLFVDCSVITCLTADRICLHYAHAYSVNKE